MKKIPMIVFRKSEEPPPSKPKSGLGKIFSRIKSGEIGGSKRPEASTEAPSVRAETPSPFRSRVISPLIRPESPVVVSPDPVSPASVSPASVSPVPLVPYPVQTGSPTPFRSRPVVMQAAEPVQGNTRPFVPVPRDRAIHHVLLSQFRSLEPEVQEQVRGIQDEILRHHSTYLSNLRQSGQNVPSASSDEYRDGFSKTSGISPEEKTSTLDLLQRIRAHHGAMREALGAERGLHSDFKHPDEFHASAEATEHARQMIEQGLAARAEKTPFFNPEFPLFVEARRRAEVNG